MTKIEWTEETWNPVVGCSVVSPGCTNCYAMDVARRLEAIGTAPHYDGTTRVVNGKSVWTGMVAQAPEETLFKPLRWKKPRKIFVNSMGDMFHEHVPGEWIDFVFAVMALCPQHTFQLLTKRADVMRGYLNDKEAHHRICQQAAVILHNAGIDPQPAIFEGDEDGIVGLLNWPLPNVWLGVSAENQEQANARIPDLLNTQAAVRFVSVEPMLGPVDLTNLDDGNRDGLHLHFDALSGLACDGHQVITGIFDQPDPKLDWVICGGESGRGARPMCPSDAEHLRDQCVDSGVPFLFKQWGEWMPEDDMPEAEAVTTYQRDFKAGRTWRFTGEPMRRVGKKRAGRLLDGREWNEFPGAVA
mgnify:FL=1